MLVFEKSNELTKAPKEEAAAVRMSRHAFGFLSMHSAGIGSCSGMSSPA